MHDVSDLIKARAWFANDIAEVAPVLNTPAITAAFATVAREDYLGDGPWGIHSRLQIGDIHQSATSNPRHLYHDVLIAIDQDAGINNGLPSLWARVFDNLNIKPGDCVVQIGAGVGYYTAILAEIVGQNGRVIAFEIETGLATRAQHNLRHYPNIEVICGDATLAKNLPNIDALFACAGVSHVPTLWLDALKPNGQLVLPYTGIDQWGFLLHLTKSPDRDCNKHPVKSLGPVGAYHCAGARLQTETEAISAAIKAARSSGNEISHYCIGAPQQNDKKVWIAGQSYWISTA